MSNDDKPGLRGEAHAERPRRLPQFSIRSLLWLMIVAALVLTCFIQAQKLRTGPTATILAPDALTTDAPRAVVIEAIGRVYEQVRLRHFMDAQGRVKFADGSSTDTSKQESASNDGDFIRGVMSFDDPAGDRVTIRDYSLPKFGTLVLWERGGGKDVQEVSVILQQELTRLGVKLR
jgi:hypothetical protein